MKKKEIKNAVKKIELMMNSSEKFSECTYYDATLTKMKTYVKLVKAISSKGYNVITFLCRDQLLWYDVNKKLYFISSYDTEQMQEVAENIFIERDTVVLIQDIFSKHISHSDIMTLYLNFNYINGRHNTKMVFYLLRENTNAVFSTYIGLKRDEYLNKTKESLENHPEYEYSALLEKMVNEYSKRNAFIILMQNFIGKDIEEFFSGFIATTNVTFYEYFCFNYLGADVEYDGKYELNADEFKQFIIDMFDDELKSYFNYYISLLYSVLREEITYIIMNKLYGVDTLQKEKNIYLDSKLVDDGVEFICYVKEDVTKHDEKPEILHSYKFTFEVLYKYMLDNTKNELTEAVEDFDESEDDYLEDIMNEEEPEEYSKKTNIDNMKFVIPANNKSTDLEKFYILIEKAIYKMDRWMKLPDLENLHRKHFERNSLKYLLYKKRELKVDLFRKGLTTLIKESTEEKTLHEIKDPTVKQRLAVLLIACAENNSISVDKTKYLYNQYKFEIVISKMIVTGSINGIEIELEYYLKSEKDDKITIIMTEDAIVDNINDIIFK